MVQYCRHDSTGSASGCGYNAPARCIFFTHGQRIGKYQSPAFQTVFITLRLYIIRRGFPPQIQRTGQYTLLIEPSFDSLAHSRPHLGQIVPNIVVFAFLHIFPITTARPFTPRENLSHTIHFVQFRCLVERLPFFGQSPSSHAEHGPFVGHFAQTIFRAKSHAVRVKRQKYRRFPHNLDRGMRLKGIENRHISQVPFSRSSKTTVQNDLERHSLRVTVQKYFGSLSRPHCMTTRRAIPYAIYLSYRFHRSVKL